MYAVWSVAGDAARPLLRARERTTATTATGR